MFHGYRMGDCSGRRGRFQRGPFVMRWEFHRGEFGGRQRRFASGELQLVLLALIAEEPRHGYDLIREIEQRTNGAYAPSPGVIYPTLTLLADMGLIVEEANDGTRKRFRVTDAGTAYLAERTDEVASLMERLAELGGMRGRGDRASVHRAMGNLRQVLINSMRDPDLGEDALDQIVSLIDEVARKIERL